MITLTLASLYILGTVFGGVGIGWIALHPPSPRVTSSEDQNAGAAAAKSDMEFRDVELQRPEGVVLRAWFIRPHEANGDAVILLHGVSDNRLGMYGYGRWLAMNHYAVLMPDARGHGNSTGLATYGLMESDDIHQWAGWVEENYYPHCLFGLGESMGAAQLLQSLPKEPRFCAVVAESPFATFREVAYARFGRQFHTGPWLGRTFFRPTVDAGFLYVRARYGLNMEAASPAEAVAHTAVPILLIHGLEDHNIPNYHSDMIQVRNPDHIVLWKIRGAGHTGAHKAAPQEFEHRVLDWFANHSRN